MSHQRDGSLTAVPGGKAPPNSTGFGVVIQPPHDKKINTISPTSFHPTLNNDTTGHGNEGNDDGHPFGTTAKPVRFIAKDIL
jgi:hypothetical protein